MKRTTIFIDEALIERAKETARRDGHTFAEVVRRAVAAYVSGRGSGPTRLPRLTGKFSSGRSDLSSRVDEYLWKEPHG